MALSAAQRVLSLPELLEKIIYYTHPDHEESHFRFLFLLRRVCKQWLSIIDTSPLLLPLTFRNPRLRSLNDEDFEICRDFMLWLQEKMKIHYMQNLNGNRKGFKSLGRFAEGVAAVGGFPDVFLTRPAMQKVTLQFSIWGDDEWAAGFREYRCGDFGSDYWVWKQYIFDRPNGVRTRDVLNRVVEILQAIYGLPGAWRIYEIVIRFGTAEDAGGTSEVASDYSIEDCEREYIFWPLREPWRDDSDDEVG
ncbi:hypothetical protein ABW19_dt0209254 [Dactylella cylindrospora]|nr:hypothetical protein ABW19_dt0209254 [Dactylella cylindrospora]